MKCYVVLASEGLKAYGVETYIKNRVNSKISCIYETQERSILPIVHLF